jgi:hypothetical protein
LGGGALDDVIPDNCTRRVVVDSEVRAERRDLCGGEFGGDCLTVDRRCHREPGEGHSAGRGNGPGGKEGEDDDGASRDLGERHSPGRRPVEVNPDLGRRDQAACVVEHEPSLLARTSRLLQHASLRSR